jgi:hypothetical protein
LAGFTIKRGVGHGGFGEVYYAVSDAGKDVALKLIRRNLEVELRGIRHCLNLKHPNLVSIFDLRCGDDGENWVVMEYVAGQSLEDAIAAHPSGMPIEQALSWFYGIAAGVACLHDHGIVHRDLKPGNIFCDEGIVKLGDYGLSKFISCSRRSGQTESVGTVHYMAPEIANGRYGKEIDIYALGVILYEILTGRVPFEGESVGEVLMKHLTAKPDVSRLAEPFQTVVARTLEKDPAKRFRSVAEMLAPLPKLHRSQDQSGDDSPAILLTPAAHPVRFAVEQPSDAASGGQASPRANGHAANATAGAKPSSDIPVAEIVDEEPVFRMVRRVCNHLADAWTESRVNTPAKLALTFILIVGVIHIGVPLLPWLMVLLTLYGVYFFARFIILSIGGPTPSPSPAAPATGGSIPASPKPVMLRGVAMPPLSRSAKRRLERDLVFNRLRQKPIRHRLCELTGSLLGSALVAIVLAVVLAIVQGAKGLEPNLPRLAWLALIGTLGSWCVLIPAKWWEGVEGDSTQRRFILMVAGLAIGLAAYSVNVALAAQLTHTPFTQLFPQIQMAHVSYVYLAAFGTLFLLVRWWRLADPLRRTRLCLFSVLLIVGVAFVVTEFWRLSPWLMLMAGTMAVAIQLAAPWVHPRDRRIQED